jgi:FtsP/CotA-like multicopper oxidase with cupredoxin domain
MALFVVAVSGSKLDPAHAQSLPRAEPNDQRPPAGRLVDGELHVELEAVEAEWYPRGPGGPRVLTPAFAEAGRSPRVPGPLIRAAAGTSVRISVRNRLERPIVVRGLSDRATAPSVTRPPGLAALPAFAFREPLVVPPGETRETRFTPTIEVSSFYFARTLPPGAGASAIARSLGPGLDEGGFMGALVIDPADAPPPPSERVLMITRWNDVQQGGEQKMLVNGLSWPFTDRVIEAARVDHALTRLG